jgi:hypothetical protein
MKSDAAVCKPIEEECETLFCNPMCIRETWKAELTCTGSLKADCGTDSVKKAMSGEFIGYGCGTETECCEKTGTSWITSWVEDQVPIGLSQTTASVERSTANI